MEKKAHLKKEIGLVVATTLVAGNMIGSGIFMLPASLAKSSGPGATLIAWIITGIGSILLALSYAKLGSKIHKTGGPYEYSKLAFGDFAGFLTAWLYWTASWIGNAAIITSIGSYATSLFPVLSKNSLYGLLLTSCILWFFTWLNVRGVKGASRTQAVITVFKILLFLFFIIITAINFDKSNLGEWFPKGKGMSTIAPAAAATLWAFTGFETSTVNAGEIKNPERNIKLSTILGMGIAIIVYISISFFSMGAMKSEVLANSNAPIIDILSLYLGKGVTKVLLMACIISVLGTTIGWILTTARMSYAAGEDKVFPKIFSKIHPKYGTPYMSLIINAVLTNLVLITAFGKSMQSAFNLIMILATLSYLPVYGSTAIAEIILLAKKDKKFNILKFIKSSFVPLLAFIYAMWAIYGTGAENVMYGFLLMLAGVPFYAYMKIKNNGELYKLEEDINKVV